MAEVFPVGEFIRDEMDARNWSVGYLAERMGGWDLVNELALSLVLDTEVQKKARIGQEMAEGLARAFGTTAEFWTNLDEAFHGKKVKNIG